MQRLQGPLEGPTITRSLMQQGAEGSPAAPRQRQVPGHSGWPFRTNREIFSLPCFDESCMYFGDCDGVFYCLDKKTGAVRWRKEGLERVDSSPTLYDRTVFFAAIDDTLYALKSESGKARWKVQLPGVGYRNPKLLNRMLYIPGEGQLLALDPSTGKVLRRYAFSGEGRDVLVEFQGNRCNGKQKHRLQRLHRPGGRRLLRS